MYLSCTLSVENRVILNRFWIGWFVGSPLGLGVAVELKFSETAVATYRLTYAGLNPSD